VRITRHALILCGAGGAPASWRRGRPSGRGRRSVAVGKADKSDDWTDRQVDDGSSFLTLPRVPPNPNKDEMVHKNTLTS
jgi:hypothetical protein